MIFDDLEPTPVWNYFYEICQIPRLSKNEEKIRGYLLAFAAAHNLEAKTDKAGNVLIIKPADPGYENRKSLVLQSHMDMVGEKDAKTEHDWEKDPVQPYIEANWVRAKDTTLGADDGIGIAASMAVLSDSKMKAGRIECLFTVDEETGMTGALELEKEFFSSRILINLDSEDEGELFIGCAGGIDTVAEMTYKYEEAEPGHDKLTIALTGLQGGHSGDEIHKGFANSVKLMTSLLQKLSSEHNIRISRFTGGNLRNAIPREAFADITCKNKYTGEIRKSVKNYLVDMKSRYKDIETGMNISITESDSASAVIDLHTQNSLLRALDKCPHGVISWSKDMEGLVKTSTNLASVKFNDGHIRIVTSQRSSDDSEKNKIAERISKIFTDNNALVHHSDGYPGWEPDTDSEILKITSSSYRKLFGRDPLVRAIHAGLECGLILEKYPGLDMISIGPTILGAHTPQERLDIETTKKFWDLLVDVINNIPAD